MMRPKSFFFLFLLIGISLAVLSLTPYSDKCFDPAATSCYANDDDNGEELDTYIGYLFSRTERVGTRSEGPEYYLRLDDGREIHIIKNAKLWEEDPVLQEKIDRNVWISGKLVDGELIYKEIKRVYG